MDTIYGSALFTIVAANGSNANAGLADVRPNSRVVIFDFRRSSHLFSAIVRSDLRLVAPLRTIPKSEQGQADNLRALTSSVIADNNVEASSQSARITVPLLNLEPAALPFSTRHPKLPTSIYTTPWFTRAWTFQEWVLSKRLLISLDDQLFWHCKQSTWCEDMLQRKLDKEGFCVDPNYPPIQRLQLKSEHLRKGDGFGEQDGAIEIKSNGRTSVTRPWSFMAYDWAVQNFSNRDLSYENDILKAFHGISRILALCLDCEMFWGLPESLLDSALLWEPVEQLQRRGTGKAFPSRSWAGWVGKVRYRDTFAISNNAPRKLNEGESHEERIRCLVRWHRIAADQNDFTALNGTSFGIKSISNQSHGQLPPD
jgi:hypothetical protein